MSLQLIAVFVDTTEVIGTAMNIEHDPLGLGIAGRFALVVVGLHLDPFGLQGFPGFAPLPPIAAANLPDAIGTKLLLEKGSGLVELLTGDFDFLDANPLRMGNPLRGESLEIFDGVMRCEGQKRPDQVQAFIVGEMCGRSLSQGFTVEILGSRNTVFSKPFIHIENANAS